MNNWLANNGEHIRRYGAVAIVDRGVFPQPAKIAEPGPGASRAHHAMTALHADHAVKIDRPHRTAAFGEDAPRAFLDLALEHPHPRRGGGERHPRQIDAHGLGGVLPSP